MCENGQIVTIVNLVFSCAIPMSQALKNVTFIWCSVYIFTKFYVLVLGPSLSSLISRTVISLSLILLSLSFPANSISLFFLSSFFSLSPFSLLPSFLSLPSLKQLQTSSPHFHCGVGNLTSGEIQVREHN